MHSQQAPTMHSQHAYIESRISLLERTCDTILLATSDHLSLTLRSFEQRLQRIEDSCVPIRGSIDASSDSDSLSSWTDLDNDDLEPAVVPTSIDPPAVVPPTTGQFLPDRLSQIDDDLSRCEAPTLPDPQIDSAIDLLEPSTAPTPLILRSMSSSIQPAAAVSLLEDLPRAGRLLLPEVTVPETVSAGTQQPQPSNALQAGGIRSAGAVAASTFCYSDCYGTTALGQLSFQRQIERFSEQQAARHELMGSSCTGAQATATGPQATATGPQATAVDWQQQSEPLVYNIQWPAMSAMHRLQRRTNPASPTLVSIEEKQQAAAARRALYQAARLQSTTKAAPRARPMKITNEMVEHKQMAASIRRQMVTEKKQSIARRLAQRGWRGALGQGALATATTARSQVLAGDWNDHTNSRHTVTEPATSSKHILRIQHMFERLRAHEQMNEPTIDELSRQFSCRNGASDVIKSAFSGDNRSVSSASSVCAPFAERDDLWTESDLEMQSVGSERSDKVLAGTTGSCDAPSEGCVGSVAVNQLEQMVDNIKQAMLLQKMRRVSQVDHLDGCEHSPAAGEQEAPATTAVSAEETAVRGWLAAKGLEELTHVFVANMDYCDVELMDEMGLDDDDLDFLEISDPTQRAILQGKQPACTADSCTIDEIDAALASLQRMKNTFLESGTDSDSDDGCDSADEIDADAAGWCSPIGTLPAVYSQNPILRRPYGRCFMPQK